MSEPLESTDLIEESSPVTAPADKGFPLATKLSDMDSDQRAAYYKFQLRQTENKLGKFADYDALRAFKEAAEADQLTDHEKAVKAARDEGFSAAETSALTKAATAILRAGLKARGVEDKEIPDILDAFNASKFIKDGDVETDRIAALAARMAGGGANTGTQQHQARQWPDMGQGAYLAPSAKPGDQGRAEAARRFKKPA